MEIKAICTGLGLVYGELIGLFTEYTTSFLPKKLRVGSAVVIIQGLATRMLSTDAFGSIADDIYRQTLIAIVFLKLDQIYVKKKMLYHTYVIQGLHGTEIKLS
ncbi:MAG: sodium/proton-translocating pyrophosphatase [Chloroflexi bacterium]|nr:sodium/proton-translocating pyrophosphatase [Chloroflexota bacterium]